LEKPEVSPAEFLILSAELKPFQVQLITRLTEKGWKLRQLTRRKAMLTNTDESGHEHVLPIPLKGKRTGTAKLIAIVLGG
jgi:hypothetical protein